LFWSPGAACLTGLASHGIQGENFFSGISSRISKNDRQQLEKAIREPEVQTLRLALTIDDSSPVPVDCRIVPLGRNASDSDPQGLDWNFQGTVLLIQDASTQIAWEHERLALREETRRDPLTGVANRTELERVHAEFIDSHRRCGTHYALIVGDIDRFKRINDEQGHPIGDDVILALAAVLRDSCRDGDLVGRYGGEEFVILCADCGLTEAARRAEAMREAFARVEYSRLEGEPVTVSFGVAELNEDDTVETLFIRADQRLLRAKSEGRNRVVS